MFSGAKNVTWVQLFEMASLYRSKGVGLDMSIKSLLGFIRLISLYSKNVILKQRYENLADVMVECRMLCNFGRMWITMWHFLYAYRRFGRIGSLYNFFTCLSQFFRIPEQIFGDLSYLQKVVFHYWSRQKLSFFYRFFKSLSLTSGLIAEIFHRREIQKKIARTLISEERTRHRIDLAVCDAIAVRCLCDMYVYFKWIPAYTPNRTLEFICGSISGMIGMWLVWKDIQSTPLFLAQPKKEMINCAKSSLETAETLLITSVIPTGDKL